VTTSWSRQGIEVENVGGPLTEERLVAILKRAGDLRNWDVWEAEARTLLLAESAHVVGETPTLTHYRCTEDGERDEAGDHIDVQVAGECMCTLPWDPDSGGLHDQTALAIAHAGQDLLDLVREVARLRRILMAARPHIQALLHIQTALVATSEPE
jgi:hypothetical protein